MNKGIRRRQILLGVLLLVAVVSAAGRMLEHYRAEELREARLQEWLRRDRNAMQKLDAIRARTEQLAELVLVFSNRAATAEAALSEEIATHEPLRRQIEKMMRETIVQKAESSGKRDLLTVKTEECVALQAQCVALTGEVTRLRRQYQVLSNELASVQADYLKAATDRATLDARFRGMTEELASVTSDRQALEAKLAVVEAELKSARAEIARLRQSGQDPKSPP